MPNFFSLRTTRGYRVLPTSGKTGETRGTLRRRLLGREVMRPGRLRLRHSLHGEAHQVLRNPVVGVSGDIALIEIISHHRFHPQALDRGQIDYHLRGAL